MQDSDPTQYERRDHVTKAQEFKRALQRQNLRFGFMDGRVEDICPEEGEETWVLNIKRGILSGLQNTMTDLNTNIKSTEVCLYNSKCILIPF